MPPSRVTSGACAGCGEKSVLRAIAAVTEAFMRPVFHAKADRLQGKAGEVLTQLQAQRYDDEQLTYHARPDQGRARLAARLAALRARVAPAPPARSRSPAETTTLFTSGTSSAVRRSRC